MLIVLINARAGYVKRHDPVRLRDDYAALVGQAGQVHLTRSTDEVAERLAGLDPATITALVPVGGDGTVSATLAAACACWGEGRLPPVLPVAGGTMNMLARVVHGRSESPRDTLARLVERLRKGRSLPSMRIPMLRAATGETGFVAGYGIPTRFLEHYNAHGGGNGQAIRSILAFSGSVLMQGELAKACFAPVAATLALDGGEPRPVRFSVLLAMTFARLPLGFRIGLPDTGTAMTLLHGSPNPASLIASLPLLHRGWFPPGVGLARQPCRHVSLTFEQPCAWQLDGDIRPPVTRLELDCSTQVTLLR